LAAKTFNCRLVTPTAEVLNEPVTYAVVPGWDGLFGVLPHRAPIVAKLGPGELRLDLANPQGESSRSFVVEDGFAQMVGDRLTILATKAVPVETLNEAEAQAELAEAEARKAPEGTGGAAASQAAKIAKDRAFARAKLRMIKARRGA
jgi:F-type H+-transporting ATPase subunit epsilon